MLELTLELAVGNFSVEVELLGISSFCFRLDSCRLRRFDGLATVSDMALRTGTLFWVLEVEQTAFMPRRSNFSRCSSLDTLLFLAIVWSEIHTSKSGS